MLQQVKQDQAQTGSQVLAGQIETLRKKVVDAEAKVEAYRAKSNLLVGNNNTTLSAQQLGDMTSQLSAARAQKADAEVEGEADPRDAEIRPADRILGHRQFGTDPQAVGTARDLRAQLAEQSSTLLDNHPRIKELKAQIADLDARSRKGGNGRAFAG